MLNFDYNKKSAYVYAFEIIPKQKEINFLKKIFLLEKLFSLNVDTVHYHLNKENVTERPYWSKQEKESKPLLTVLSEDGTISDFADQKNVIHLITTFDEVTLMSMIEGDPSHMQDNIDYNQSILSCAENFLCLPEITKENRFEFYFEKAEYIFHKDILPHVYNLIDCLDKKIQYLSPDIEIFNQRFNLLPASLEETIDFPLLNSFSQIDDFGFMNTVDNHILYALKFIFSKHNDFKGEIKILLDHVNHTIVTSHIIDNEVTLIKKEENALLAEHNIVQIRHECLFDLQTVNKDKITEMLNELWANFQAANNVFFVHTPDLPEKFSHVCDTIFSYIVNTQRKSLNNTINKELDNSFISQINKRI